MKVTLPLLCCLSAFVALPLHAQSGAAKSQEALPEAQLVSLATATGALSGGVLFSVYLGIVNADESHLARMDAKTAEMHLIRHLSTASVVTSQIGQMRKAFGSDQAFMAYLSQLESGVEMLTSQASALRSTLKGSSTREASQYEAKKEASRKFLIELLKLPDNREIVP